MSLVNVVERVMSLSFCSALGLLCLGDGLRAALMIHNGHKKSFLFGSPLIPQLDLLAQDLDTLLLPQVRPPAEGETKTDGFRGQRAFQHASGRRNQNCSMLGCEAERESHTRNLTAKVWMVTYNHFGGGLINL